MDEWTEHIDETSGQTFYFNAVTGATSWERPASSETLLPGWTEHVDADSGCTFYYNATTQETRWEKPQSAPEKQEKQEPQSPLPEGWAESTDPETDQVYYFNKATGESSWEKPLAPACVSPPAPVPQETQLPKHWAESVDPESGHTFYYNSVTGESSWEKPAVPDPSRNRMTMLQPAKLSGVKSDTSKERQSLSGATAQEATSYQTAMHAGKAPGGLSSLRGDVISIGGDGAALQRELELPGQKLGQGSFGSVHKVRQRSSGRSLVLKTVTKQSGTKEERLAMTKEIEVLRALDHPHIIRIFGCYEDYRHLYVVMEPAEGGELYKIIQQCKKQGCTVHEGWAALVMQQVLGAIAYCHERGIMHKDLKCENVMLLNSPPPGRSVLDMPPHAVVIDLGLAEVFAGALARSIFSAGTCTTMAPEVWQGSFGPKCDVWSLGCVLFELLSGRSPFFARNLEDASEWLRLHRAGPDWRLLGHVSAEARQLCQRMLEFDQRPRPGAQQCLGSNWLKNCTRHASGALGPKVKSALADALGNWRERSELQQAVSFQIAAGVSSGSVEELNAIFRNFDKNSTGTLSKEELEAALTQLGLNSTEIVQIVASLDQNMDGKCEYSEFLAASLAVLDDQFDDMLWDAFKRFDLDGNGYLSESEVRRVFEDMKAGSAGRGGAAAAASASMRTIDINRDGKVSFDEFLLHFGRGKTAKKRGGKESGLMKCVQHSAASGPSSTTKKTHGADLDGLLDEIDAGMRGPALHQDARPLPPPAATTTRPKLSQGKPSPSDDLDSLLAELG